jgi:hypothetical protein
MKSSVLFGAILVLSVSLAPAQTAKDYVTGTVVDIQQSSDDSLVNGTTVGNSYQNYTVQIGNMIYTAYCTEKLITSHCDTDFVIGAQVQVRIDGQHIYIVRANGKEQKAKIFRKKLAK